MAVTRNSANADILQWLGCLLSHTEMALAFRICQRCVVPIQKSDIEIIEKVPKRATKLIISLKHLSYSERLKQLQLPTLKYRRLRGDMIQVFKMVHKYDVCAAVKLNFNTLSTTWGNKYKLQKSASHYNFRKFSF